MLRQPYPSLSDHPDVPFLVQHVRLHERAGDSHYTPAARVVFAPGLKTSELFQALPGEEVKTLFALLASVSPNGNVQASASDVASTLGIPERKARDRLLRLETLLWRGEPLIRTVRLAPGVDAFAPGPHLLAHEHPPEPIQNPPVPTIPVTARIPVTSTMPFTTPPASLETALQEIEQQLQKTTRQEQELSLNPLTEELPSNSVEAMRDAIVGLCRFGVSEAEAANLVSVYPLERIERQISWMEHRNAKVPSRFLIAAIHNDYGPPDVARHRFPEPREGVDREV